MSIGSAIFFVPSFYGAVTWALWLICYRAGILDWSAPSSASMYTFLFVQAALLLSLFLHLAWYRKVVQALPERGVRVAGSRRRPASAVLQILVPAAIGATGLLIHFAEISRAFGGIASILEVFVTSSHEIRWQNRDTSTIGIQLSYFGWLACGLVAYHYRRGVIGPHWWLLVLALFLGNLGFVDRTRPFWILFTVSLMSLAAVRPPPFVRIAGRAVLLVGVLIGLFAGIAVWVGKLGDHSMGKSPIEAAYLNLVLYGTSGFAYFDEITAFDSAPSYVPLRIAYPVTKILSTLDLGEEPPPQVLDPEYLPYYTNVGTFLEPLYMDGGLLYVVLGTLALSFGADWLGLRCIRSGRGVAIFFWANLCFASCFAFFVPRFTTTAFWLFGFLALGQAILVRMRMVATGRSVETAGGAGVYR